MYSIYSRYSFVKRTTRKIPSEVSDGIFLVKTLLLWYSMAGTVFQFPSGVAHKRRRLSLPAPKRRARRFFFEYSLSPDAQEQKGVMHHDV
jgi:hypothetical protein